MTRTLSLLVILAMAGCTGEPPAGDDAAGDDDSTGDDDSADDDSADDDDSSGDDDSAGDDDSSGDDDSATPLPSPYEILWVGDILLADAALPDLQAHGYLYPFDYLWPLLEGDTLIGNAEGPITSLTAQYNPGQTWNYNADPLAAPALAAVGFDALSLANNHTFDRGPDGMFDTIDLLAAEGVVAFGAGGDYEAARAPFLIDTPYGRIAVVGINKPFSTVPGATATAPGSFRTGSGRIADGYAAAITAGADYVIGYIHWGDNYSLVNSDQIAKAEFFASAGYDLVIGHGSHMQQTFDFVDGMPVLYSLGNFTFGTPGRFDANYPGYGLVARTLHGPTGIEGLELRCIRTDNDGVDFQPRPCGTTGLTVALEGLSPLVVMDGETGVIAL